jgi:hypothetical protein
MRFRGCAKTHCALSSSDRIVAYSETTGNCNLVLIRRRAN